MLPCRTRGTRATRGRRAARGAGDASTSRSRAASGRVIVGRRAPGPARRARAAAARRRGGADAELEWASHLSLAAVLLPPLPADVYPVARRLQGLSKGDVVAGVGALPPRVARGEEAARGPGSTGDVADPWLLGPRAAALRPLGGALRRARVDGDALPWTRRGAGAASR